MDSQQSDNGVKGKFYIEDNGKEAAAMHYVYADKSKIIIDHTEVGLDYEGKGLGKQLLIALVKFVRAKEIKVIPLCPFARSVFKKMPEYGDVLA